MDGYLHRAIAYIRDPVNKSKVRLATAGTTVGFDSLVMYAVNADKNREFFTRYVACKAGSAALFLSIVVPKLTRMVAKASSDLEAHLKYQALNFAYCIGEFGLYNIADAPDPRQSALTFAVISGAGGAALTHITRHPGLGKHLRASGEHALEALFWIGRTFYNSGKRVYNGGKAVTHAAARAVRKESIDDLFDESDIGNRFYSNGE